MTVPFSLHETAPAKVNLALHVVERLPNGYHRLDSIAVFTDIGDRLEAELRQDGELRLTLEGEFAEGLPISDNLILRAANLLQQQTKTLFGADIRLLKHIPVGAGLGGGSADAAAALRLLNRLWQTDCNDAILAELGGQLGADIPACVFSAAVRMEGIGDRLSPVPQAPRFPLVLVYPHIPLWTPDVYRAMTGKSFSGILHAIPGMEAGQAEWRDWLRATHNDLEAASRQLLPHIETMLDTLLQCEGCVLSRMSGSGSACFGIFETDQQAAHAQKTLKQRHPGWWVRAASGHSRADGILSVRE